MRRSKIDFFGISYWKNALIPLFLVVIIFLLSILLFVKSPINKKTTLLLSPSEFRTYWKSEILRTGASNAYRELKDEYSQYPIHDQHFGTHKFGEILSELNGARGISVCDSAFLYGCYHGLIGRLIGDNGLSMVKEVGNACENLTGQQQLACFHGIGHGIIEYSGHNGEKLASTLRLCDQFGLKSHIRACQSGAFMEYNLPTLINTDTKADQARNYDPSNPFYPCDTLPLDLKNVCYFRLPEYWEAILSKDHTAMGKICQKAITSESKKNCFQGIGYFLAPSKKYSVQEIIKSCKTMPDNKSEISCRAGAAAGLFSNPDTESVWSQPCDNLVPIDKHNCINQVSWKDEK